MKNWQSAVERFNRNGKWDADLGAPPGDPACQVPEAIAVEFYGCGVEQLVALFGNVPTPGVNDREPSGAVMEAVHGDEPKEPSKEPPVKTGAPQSSMEALRAGQRAKQFLRTNLADGPVLATEMNKLAEAAGIAPRTLSRAREGLSITAFKDAFGGPWYWRLPKHLEIELGRMPEGADA